MSWNIGERAVIGGCVSNPEVNGMECTVASTEMPRLDSNQKEKLAVQIDGITGHGWAFLEVLRKPYNGHSKCSWESMKDIWTPDVIATPILERI